MAEIKHREMRLLNIPILPAAVAMLAVASTGSRAQSPSIQQSTPSTHMETHHAKGTFEVDLKPQPLADADAGAKLGRMSASKQFAGDLVGTSKGEMLSAGTDVKGSAGYVAIERVVGTLNGRKGSFVLQHSATMNRGVPQSSITVVPGSGTEGFFGIAGTFRIEQNEGKHFYDFEYTLPK